MLRRNLLSCNRCADLVQVQVRLDDVRNDRDASPLVRATAYGRTAVAAMLLDWGADFNAHDDRNRTALHHAVRRGDPEAVALLLEPVRMPTRGTTKEQRP